jgi:hypothetical protein
VNSWKPLTVLTSDDKSERSAFLLRLSKSLDLTSGDSLVRQFDLSCILSAFQESNNIGTDNWNILTSRYRTPAIMPLINS